MITNTTHSVASQAKLVRATLRPLCLNRSGWYLGGAAFAMRAPLKRDIPLSQLPLSQTPLPSDPRSAIVSPQPIAHLDPGCALQRVEY